MNKDKHIPQGYKDSPLGIIPQDWEVKRLGDCFEIAAGRDLEKDHYSPIRTSQYPYPIFSNSLENRGLYGYTAVPRHKANSITITGRGSLGHAEYRQQDFDAIIRLLVLTPKIKISCKLITEYINFITPFIYESTGVPQLTAPQIKNTQLLLPPYNEQIYITEVLDYWDTAIEKQSELIEKLKLRKRALMQQLLTGKKRLPGFSGKWIHVPIKTFAKEVSNRNVGGANHIVLSCTKYDGLVPSLEYFGKQIYSNDLSSYKIIPQGHFAYATNHIEEGSIGYQSNYENGLISPMYTVFVTNKGKVNDTFLYAVLKSHHLIYLYKSMMEGSINRRGGLRWDPFSTIKIDLPSLEEQNAIASVLIKADKEIKLAKDKLANLQYQKRGLMQQLLTGKKRII